jgi:hypothetical protein
MSNDKIHLTGIFHVTMYGEKPGSTLEEKYYYLTADEEQDGKSAESGGSCHCLDHSGSS